MPINLEKIQKEFEKGNIDEQIKAFFQLKDFVAQLVAAEQKAKEEQANALQYTYSSIVRQA